MVLTHLDLHTGLQLFKLKPHHAFEEPVLHLAARQKAFLVISRILPRITNTYGHLPYMICRYDSQTGDEKL